MINYNYQETKLWLLRLFIITMVTIGINNYLLASHVFIITQNLYYIPIIIACYKYLKSGFIFSIVLALFYLFHVSLYTQDTIFLLESTIRVIMFICIASIVTYLSYQRIHTNKFFTEILSEIPGTLFQFYVRPDRQRGLYYVSISNKLEKLFHLNSSHSNNLFNNFFKLIDNDYKKSFLTSLEKAISNKSELKYEGKLKNLKGDIMWFSIHATPIQRKNELVYNGILHDITDSKLIEENLQIHQIKLKTQNEELLLSRQEVEILKNKYFDLYNLAPIGYITLNKEKIITEANLTATTMFGTSKNNLINIPLSNFISSQNQDIYYLYCIYCNNIIKNQKMPSCELQMYDFEMKPFWVQLEMILSNNIENEAIYYVIINNITERKKMENTIKENEAIFSAFLKHSPVLIFFKDHNIRALRLSQNFEKLLNMPLDNIIGKTMDELFPSDLSKKMIEDDKKVLHENQCMSIIEKFNGKTYETTKFPIVINGNPNILAGFTIDITEQIQMQTSIIQNERLSAINELILGIAHDFNNNLFIIQGNAEIALSSPDIPNEILESLKIIYQTTKDISIKVKQLQKFSQKTIFKQFHPLDINNLLDEAILNLKPLWKNQAQINGIEYTFQKSFGKIEYVDGNENELDSVFRNLITNSLEAMPNGGKIICETGIIDQKVYIRIIDIGIGMNEEVQKIIFEPFFITKEFKKKGFGMNEVLSIIQNHGGTIVIKNTQVNQGTTIEILLPAKENKNVNHQLSIRILWVDDEELIRKIGAKILKHLDHSVDTAGSGYEALELLNQNQYDLMITDIGMPGMNGWKLIENLKNNYATMKIAVLTGHGVFSDEYKDKANIDRVSYFFPKPIPTEELEQMIAEIIKTKK